MTTIAPFNYSTSVSIADVVASPRGRRMSWNVAAKYNEPGKQEGPI
jgi:hypothetical protein